jgi:hypothetical protein
MIKSGFQYNKLQNLNNILHFLFTGLRHPTSGIRHPASGIRHPASGFKHLVSSFVNRSFPELVEGSEGWRLGSGALNFPDFLS